jgi:hypothetical protein
MRTATLAAAAALCAMTATAAPAQEMARGAYVYLPSHLEIVVDGDGAGTLRLIRGQEGRVEVAARAREGFPAFGLSPTDERLVLTAVGATSADFVVIVPPAVRVTARLPDRAEAAVFGARRPLATLSWGADAAPAAAGSGLPAQPRGAATGAGAAVTGAGAAVTGAAGPLIGRPLRGEPAHVVFRQGAAPAEVVFPDPAAVRTVTVRVEGTEFLVRSGRPLSIRPGDPRHLELRTAAPPMDFVVVVPPATPAFRLRIGADEALALRGGAATAQCAPLLEQQLSDGRRWFTFSPSAGRLACGQAVRSD